MERGTAREGKPTEVAQLTVSEETCIKANGKTASVVAKGP